MSSLGRKGKIALGAVVGGVVLVGAVAVIIVEGLAVRVGRRVSYQFISKSAHPEVCVSAEGGAKLVGRLATYDPTTGKCTVVWDELRPYVAAATDACSVGGSYKKSAMDAAWVTKWLGDTDAASPSGWAGDVPAVFQFAQLSKEGLY